MSANESPVRCDQRDGHSSGGLKSTLGKQFMDSIKYQGRAFWTKTGYDKEGKFVKDRMSKQADKTILSMLCCED